MKIKTTALARKLTNDKLKEIYGEDAIWEENTNEFQGLVYKDQVRSDADLLFQYFLQEIHDHIEYPFKKGDPYYIIDKKQVCITFWDDKSEEMYRSNPDMEAFNTESQAYEYMSRKYLRKNDIDHGKKNR